ncbi:MAG: UvrD-helicase domain-containing protein, partial [Mariprofundus sp.]
MSAEVRNQAIDVSASCLVQAPAGSGKTELLTQRILALLAIVDEPEEILALTFTRKAAAEMGGRVIDALCMQKPDNDSHKMLTWQLASAALQRSQECGWNLAEHPARLRVMTLDSLAGSLARQLPLLSGLGDMPAPSEHSIALYKEAVESVLNQAMSRNFAAVETLLLHQDHNTGSVIELMAKMLENREQWLVHIANHGRNTASLKEALESNLAELISHQIRQCDAAIPIAAKAALPALIQFAGRQLNDMAMTDFKAWPNADIESLSCWKLLATVLLTGKDPAFKKSLSKNHGFPPAAKDEKQQMQTILSMLADIPELAGSLHRLRSLPDSSAFDDGQWH